MKQEEYKPQFEENFTPPISRKTETYRCSVCGKESVSLHKGVCFKCRESAEPERVEERVAPNFGLFLEWRRNQAMDYGRVFGRMASLIKLYGTFTAVLILLTSMLLAVMIVLRDRWTLSEWIIIGSVSAAAVILTAVRIMGNGRRVKRIFAGINEKVVVTGGDERWLCPCCKTSNEYVQHCTTCGVRPHILTIKEHGQ